MNNPKINIRPKIKNIGTSDNKKQEELFQNETIRPIIKLQHELLLAFFRNYLIQKKININKLNDLKKTELVVKIFKNDTRLKVELRGLIIGHFTEDEYQNYLQIAAETNRRIINIIKERLTPLV